MISDKALQEYKEIYKKNFGTKIDNVATMEQATSLLTLVNVVYCPIKKEWLEEHNSKKGNKRL
jgi:hypothetical protein